MGVCTRVTTCIANQCFTSDFYHIPWHGFDTVLGVKWLQTLRPILGDFQLL